MMMLIQKAFDSLGTGGTLLVLLLSLVVVLLVGVSHYRRSLEVRRAAFNKGFVSQVLMRLLP
jgi:Tfp pilus assembly protein PilX